MPADESSRKQHSQIASSYNTCKKEKFKGEKSHSAAGNCNDISTFDSTLLYSECTVSETGRGS